MAERESTLHLKLDANVDGFAAQLLDALAEQLDVAAAVLRDRADALRHATDREATRA